MMLRSNKYKIDLENKLSIALEELKNTKTLCSKLLEEREDSEREIKTMVDRHTALKNEMAELHIRYLNVVEQRDQLQRQAAAFTECSDVFEATLNHTHHLEMELSEARTHVSLLERKQKLEQKLEQELDQTSSSITEITASTTVKTEQSERRTFTNTFQLKSKNIHRRTLKQIKKGRNNVRNLKKQVTKLQKKNKKLEYNILTNDVKKLIRCEQSDIIRNTVPEEGNNVDITKQKEPLRKEPKKKNIIIFSDEYGVGLGSCLQQNIHNSNANITNYCKPGATCEKILEDFDYIVKSLDSNDTVIIFISRMNTYNTLSYVKQIGKIVSNKERKFNIILCSTVCHISDNYCNSVLNQKLSQLSTTSENVMYVELNNGFKRNKKDFHNIIHNSIIQFKCSSSLTFIKCDENLRNSSLNFQASPENTGTK